jgi:hypothetical protein
MAKLTSYRRIITNDFAKEDKQFVEQLASPINDSFNELYFSVNGRLGLRENIFCSVKDLDIITNAAGIPTTSTSFRLDKEFSVIGCQVIRAENQSNSAVYPTGQPFLSYIQNGSSIIINHISNLQAGQRYTIRVVAYG